MRSTEPRFVTSGLGTESFGGTCFCLGGFLFAVLGRGGGFEAPEETMSDACDFVDGGIEGGFVGL